MNYATLNQYFDHSSVSSQKLTIGDNTNTKYIYKTAINHLVMFNKILTRNEMNYIAKSGGRSISKLDPSLLGYYYLPTNDLLNNY